MDQANILTDIKTLYTNTTWAKRGSAAAATTQDLKPLHNAWLAISSDGCVEAYGNGDIPVNLCHYPTRSLNGQMVMPGLIDSHTHPIFGGNRSHEFCSRLDGATYQEIAAAGGGIQASISATAHASDDELIKRINTYFAQALAWGITTIEVKSGYAASIEHELRLLRLLHSCAEQAAQHVEVTCLALHAVPPQFPSAQIWAETCRTELLPVIHREQLARFVDMFIEDGYFSVDDCSSFVETAQELGLLIKVHADEFSDAQAGLAAAKWQAVSADHLQCTPLKSLTAMAKAHTVGTLLPGTSLYTGIPFTDGQALRDAGCTIAIASDYNPGSCRLLNLPLIATMAALHCKLNLAEAVAGVTFAAAQALRIANHKGALAEGYDADFLVCSFSSIEEWLADAGQTPPSQVWIKGQQII